MSTQKLGDREFLKVEPEALRQLTAHAMSDIAHLLRPGHLQQLANILKDPEATKNDRFVALELLKNANIASARILPGYLSLTCCPLLLFLRLPLALSDARILALLLSWASAVKTY